MKRCLIIGIVSLLCFKGYAQETEVVAGYQPKDFSSLIGHVKGFNNELLAMHIKLYEGYVKNTNQLLQGLRALRNQT